ncbi:hypothetical protein [Blastococcus brunescens]|uniref:Peptidase S11 D-alanyl-D-alanine carboxypeptidase A N-terminal domain-containing protein n=1 Tax=Blastococcus brunescens TaxID=1564165 RepID=A0ABZ1B0X8_9ACTN|nr:hypothetical protein [Blastococcus sp. BMG 8361]WRL62989.1 hypothetical protein U6N30_24545 [Blastococcus sp. BMG 8361]
MIEGTTEDENIEGSRVGLVRGGRYPVSLLFQALILQSGNDAANALARAAGGMDVTLAAMNETAERIGAYDTVAGSPSGLDVAGQSSSPYDLALVFRALLADPGTAAVLTTPTADMPPVEGRSPATRSRTRTRWPRLPATSAARPASPTPPGTPSSRPPSGTAAGWSSASWTPRTSHCARPTRRRCSSTGASPSRPAPTTWARSWPRGPAAVAGAVQRLRRRTEDQPAATDRDGRTRVRGDDVPWLPVALGGAAVVILTATVAGRRRAVRVVPALSSPPDAPPGAGSPPRSAGGSTSRRP